MATSILYPINELKRRLEDNECPLAKRLCLAKNALNCVQLPIQRESIVVDWLELLSVKKEKDCIKNVLKWFENYPEPSALFVDKVVEILIEYYKKGIQPDMTITKEVIELLDKDVLFSINLTNINGYVELIEKMLTAFKNNPLNESIIPTLFKTIEKFYSRVIKKVEFLSQLIKGHIIDALFVYYNTNLKLQALELCKMLFFPFSKKGFFINYLQTVVTSPNLKELLREKGEKMVLIQKIFQLLLLFPEGCKTPDYTFIENFIETFVFSYKDDSHIIALFYIVALQCVGLEQQSLKPVMHIKKLNLNESKVRKIYCKCLEILNLYDVDLQVGLTERKKAKDDKIYFNQIIHNTTLHLFSKNFKPDAITMKIIIILLKLDPSIEAKIAQFLPTVFVAKKDSEDKVSTFAEFIETYLELQFKLSKGTEFMSKLLPNIRNLLEPKNTEQFELAQSLVGNKSFEDCERIKNQILNLEDLFPASAFGRFGVLTSKLLLRQENEMFLSLQREFETNCLMLLENNFISPSILIECELLSSLICSVLEHGRMSDHSVPEHVAKEFWENFTTFEKVMLKKLGVCAIKLTYKTQLLSSFTRLAVSCGRVKLLNARYSNVKLTFDNAMTVENDIYDLSAILPSLSGEEWRQIAEKIKRGDETKLIDDLNTLVLQKLILLELTNNENQEIKSHAVAIKSHLLKELNIIRHLLEVSPHFSQIIFDNLSPSISTSVARNLIKMTLKKKECISIFNNTALSENRPVIRSLLIELLKMILKFLEGNGVGLKPSLCKSLGDDSFDFIKFTEQLVDVTEYMENLSHIPQDSEDLENIEHCLEVIKMLKVYALDENCQLLTLFTLMATKRALKISNSAKKCIKNIDFILLSLFEMASKPPDIYKIFPVKYVISFGENSLIDLATLKLKSQNKMLPVSSFLSVAVKKVKTEPAVIRDIVTILLTDQKSRKREDSTIGFFSNDVFKITCLLLPIIAKEKKAITTSNFRSILADLQEKLHKSLLKSFKNVDFENVELGEIVNAIDSYTLTLVRYVESNNPEDVKNLDLILGKLEYFFDKALTSLQDANTKPLHTNSYLQLLNAALRNNKKLQHHTIFTKKDNLKCIWTALKARISLGAECKFLNVLYAEELSVGVRFFAEMCSIEFCTGTLFNDLNNMTVLKPPQVLTGSKMKMNESLINHESASFTIKSILKSNIAGEKSSLLSKVIVRLSKNLSTWLKTYYLQVDSIDCVDDLTVKDVMIDGDITDVIKIDLELIADMILSAKKVSLSFKCMDALFETLNLCAVITNCQLKCHVRYVLSNDRYFDIFEAVWRCLNNLLLSRPELLEDRWPCFLKIYRSLMISLCLRSNSAEGNADRRTEDKMAENALAVEKLTQSMSKKKQEISHLAAYMVADFCHLLETSPPSRKIRQNFENCITYLIQVAESAKHSMAFLKRALSDTNGVATLINMYTIYKRYHKYSGAS